MSPGIPPRQGPRHAETDSAILRLQRLCDALAQKNRRLARFEKRYHELFDMAGGGIIKTDLEGRIILANRMAGVILGNRRLKGRRLGSFLVGASADRLAGLLKHLAGGGTDLQEAEVELPGKEDPKTLNLRAVPLVEDGRIQELEIILTDVSEGVRQQKLMKKLQERAIVAGLSRHLSHVLLNALASAGGQWRKVLRFASANPPLEPSVNIIGEELNRMEDVVRGYQDYVNIMNLHASVCCHLGEFLDRFLLTTAPGADQEADRILRPVRAHLNLWRGTIAPEAGPVFMDPAFLRLGLYYLIRGAAHLALGAGKMPVPLLLGTSAAAGSASLTMLSSEVSIREEAIAALYVPWEHQMLHQTFDDWGIAIANGVAERHNGGLEISVIPTGVLYEMHLPVASGEPPAKLGSSW